MSGNITLTDTLSINNKKLSIDLNGHTITAANNQRAFNINGGTLEIKDSVGNGIIQGNGTVTGHGGAIYMEGSGSALTISGGTIPNSERYAMVILQIGRAASRERAYCAV